jgi:uncharacterized membrane protein
MFSFIFNTCAAIFFFTISLGGALGMFLYGDQFLPMRYATTVGLCGVLGLLCAVVAKQAKDAWDIERRKRNAGKN